MTQTAATTDITGAGLTLGTVSMQASSSAAAGTIISESPTAGTNVASGSTVTLVVSSGAPTVSVPDVVGLSQAAATSAITGAGLVVGTVTTERSATVGTGDVISQTPEAGSMVAAAAKVNVSVSSGMAQVAVPNVVGLTQSAAEGAVADAGLIVGTVTMQNSSTVAMGLVISESPVAGSSVAAKSSVSFVISTGVPEVLVPTVVGLTQSAATQAITTAGLSLGTVTTQASTSVAAGIVISESPGAGTSVPFGTIVSVLVSSGTPKILVPNIVGLTQAAATTEITSTDLVLGSVTTQPSTTVPSGLVISESPVAATSVSSGSTVSFILSSGAPTPVAVVDPNPAEATIAVVNVSGQHLVTYSGTKQSSGTAQSITSVVVDSLSQSPSNRVVIGLDGQGRPTSASLADGSTVTISYASPTQIDFTVTDNEGEQGTMVFNPTTGTVTSVSAAARTTPTRRGAPSAFKSEASRRTSSAAIPSTTGGATGQITVSCSGGSPISDALVTGTFIPNNVPLSLGLPNTFSLPIWPTTIAAGSYTYVAPTSPFQSDPTLAQQVLDSIPPLVGDYCSAINDFENLSYGTVEEAIKNTPLTAYLAAEFPVAIVTAIGAIEVVCTANGIVENTATIANGLAVVSDFLSAGGNIQFQASRPSEKSVTAPPQLYSYLSSSPPNFAIEFPCLTLQISPANPTVLIGGVLQLSATGTDSTNAPVAISPIWDSPNADDAVATITSAGLVAGYGQGAITARVTDTASGDSAIANVTASAISLQIVPAAPSVAVGGTIALTVTASSPSGVVPLPADLQWSPGNSDVATVASSTNGTAVVTGVSAGTATITVTDPVSQATATALVTVTGASGSYAYQPSFEAVGCNDTATITTTVVDSSGNTVFTITQSYTNDGSAPGSTPCSSNSLGTPDYLLTPPVPVALQPGSSYTMNTTWSASGPGQPNTAIYALGVLYSPATSELIAKLGGFVGLGLPAQSESEGFSVIGAPSSVRDGREGSRPQRARTSQ